VIQIAIILFLYKPKSVNQMKTIRYVASGLLLLTGVLHILPIIKTPSDPNSLPMLAFGIIYFAIGVLLIMKVRFSSLSGIIFPLVGLGIGFFVIGFKNWNGILSFMFIIDAVVIVCCAFLLRGKDKG
jgi:uncharacterized membrane protein HdeD (DUF308 family)